MGREVLTQDLLRKTVAKYETINEVATELGWHRNTILNKCHQWAIPLKKGPKARATSTRSQVSRFFAKYRGELPATTRELSELSGCTEDAIRNYAYRLRKLSKTIISAQPWRNNGVPVMWKDISGTRIPDRAFDIVRTYMSRWGSIKFVIRLKTGAVHVFKFTPGQLRSLYKS